MKYESLTYWANFTVKNGEKTIKLSLENLLSQSVKPSLICIVNDGSTDSTLQILNEFKKKYEEIIHIINLPDKGYDIRRVVHNLNEACKYVENSGKVFDFMLIANEDVIFPNDYVELLINEMKNDSKLVVLSGSRGIEPHDDFSFPEGAGRLIRMSYFKEIGFHFPPYYGYEAWLLYKALQLEYKIKKIANLKYKHLREFGSEHMFVEYGPTMRCLGYHPLFVIGRVLRNIFIKKTGISRKASIMMLLGYLQESKWKNDPYYHYFESDLRRFIRSLQKKRLLSKFRI